MKWFATLVVVSCVAVLPQWPLQMNGPAQSTLAGMTQGIVSRYHSLGSWQNPDSGWDDPACPCYPLTPDMSDDGPVGNNDAQIRFNGSPVNVLIDENTMNAAGGMGALAYGVRGGNGGGDVTLTIDGGDLEIGGFRPTAPNGDREGWHFDIGRGFETNGAPSTQRVIMTGGNVETNGPVDP